MLDSFLESWRVPTENAVGITSHAVLQNGVTYTLVAWGDFQYGAASTDRGDAQYHKFSSPTPYSGDGVSHIGLTLSGVTVVHTYPIWGTYSPLHRYALQVIGQGMPVHAFYLDTPSAYATHHGSISLALDPPSANVCLPPDTPPVQWCDQNGDLSQTAPGSDGGYSAGPAYGDGGIRYFDGEIRQEAGLLSADGFGTAWGASLDNSNWYNKLQLQCPSLMPTDLDLGTGMTDPQQPFVINDTSSSMGNPTTLIVVTSGTNARYFDLQSDGVTYLAREFRQDRLVYANGMITFIDTKGDQLQFYDFSHAVQSLTPAGVMAFYKDKAGHQTMTNYDATGNLLAVSRSGPSGANMVTETYAVSHNGTGPNAQVSQIALQRQVNNGTPAIVRQVMFAYYGSTGPNGSYAGALETAQVQEPDPNNNGAMTTFDTYYYRYDGNGYLQYVFTPPSYDRLVQNVGDPTVQMDSVVQPYADYYYNRGSTFQVTVQGAGCSSCTNGQGTFSYAIQTQSGNTPGYNSWTYETIETLPDGSTRTVFANDRGETMLSVFQSGGQQWETFYKYDGSGRVLWIAHPSALTGYDSTKADLLNADANGHYQYLRDNQGLVEVKDYYTDDTGSGETTPGDALGYLADTKLQMGQAPVNGMPIQVEQESFQYYLHQATAGGSSVTVRPVATDTTYQNTDGTGAELTQNTYAWQQSGGSPTAQVATLTVQKPLILAGRNGPDGTNYDIETTTYDAFGRATQVVDADNKVVNYTYDQATGAVTQMVQDAGGVSPVSLAGAFNPGRIGIATDGMPFSGVGLDGTGDAYSASFAPNGAVTWNTRSFTLGPANQPDVVVGGPNVVVNLPAAGAASLSLLATAVGGGMGQMNQTFTVTYSDGSTQTYSRSLSDWLAPQNYPGEAAALTMPYYDTAGGGRTNQTANLYGYSLALNPLKQVQSLTLPNNNHVVLLAASLTNLDLTTSYTVDPFGRDTAIQEPNGTAQFTDAPVSLRYMVYNDFTHETRTYGWNGTTNTPVGPTQLTREDRSTATVYHETLTMSAPPHLTGGVPDGTEPISQVQSLRRDLTNKSGQVVEHDDYVDVGPGYSSSAQIAGAHDNATLYGYDDRGRRDRTVSANGTISRTAYDALGRVVGTWVGTNDTTTTQVSLSSAFTRTGITSDGSTFSSMGGLDGSGHAYSASFFPNSSVTWNTLPFTVGPADMNDVVVASNQTLTLPHGNATALTLLATAVGGVNGGEMNQSFTVTYTDGSMQTFTQSLSDWMTPLNYPGESTALTMTHFNNADGSTTPQAVDLYAYSFPLDPSRQVQSLKLPPAPTNGGGVVLLAATLTNADWSTANTAPSNMIQVSADYYDQATIGDVSGVGDSNLTEMIQYPHGNTNPPDPANPPRASNMFYDWRDRLVYTKAGYQATEDTSTHRPITYLVYDNLDEVTSTQRYDGDTVNTVSYMNGVPQPPSFNLLRAQTATHYDAQGRVYQTDTYSVSTGGFINVSPLTTNNWYNHRGLLVKTSAPGGLVQKMSYDGAGRETFVFTTDGNGDAGAGVAQGWFDAQQVNSSNTVLTQTQTQYDGDSNPVFVTTWDRYHNSSYTGDLSMASTQQARISFDGKFYDAADRLTNEANYGNNGNTFLASRPNVIAIRGTTPAQETDYAYTADTVQTVFLSSGTSGGSFTLTFNGQTATINFNDSAATVQSDLQALSSIGMYNVQVTGPTGAAMTPGGPWNIRFTGTFAGQNEPLLMANGSGLTGGTVTVALASQAGDSGRVQTMTDPRGIATKTDYDLAGRTLRTVVAFNNNPSFTNNWNQVTEYTYDGDNHVQILTAYPGDGSIQQTQYTYTANPADSTWVSSNDLLTKVQYPDKTSGRPSTQPGDQEIYLYDNLGETRTKTERTGTVHNYSFDVLGRPTLDSVSTFGMGVDPTVGGLGVAYDTYGNAATFTSYAPNGTTILNQVQRTFNGLGQLTAETQYHGDPGLMTTPHGTVSYVYSGPATGMNYSRLMSMTYPNGRVLHFGYNTSPGSVDDAISRLSFIADDNGSGGVGLHLEDYLYLGLNTVVQRSHSQTGINLTYIGTPGGDAMDQYVGLDRFGRVVDQNWQGSSGSTDNFAYGYDYDSNRLYQANLVTEGLQMPQPFDELYHVSGTVDTYSMTGQLQSAGYDVLNQMTSFSRGTLSADHKSISSVSHSQSWTLDALGNWKQFGSDGPPQMWTTNQQNELTQINGGTVNLGFDNNGNTTQDDYGHHLVYDAWNRLVTVSTGGNPMTTLASYRYDALGRRIQSTLGMLTTTDLYYSDQWQVLEEDQAGVMTQQYVWSPVYVDALVERDSAAGSLRLYVQQDANWNVTALIDTTGAVQERFIYDPYGKPTDATGQNVGALNANWTTKTGGDSYSWVYLHQGGRYEASTGLYNFRHRDQSPTLGRWMELDPKSYAAGDRNLYGYEREDPAGSKDPSGLESGGYVQDYTSPRRVDVRGDPGFKVCQRNIQATNSYDDCANKCGGQHVYVQYGGVDKHGQPLKYTKGVGFYSGGVVEEKAFKPNSCDECKRTNSPLSYGIGAGKLASKADDEEILDCIENYPPSRKYHWITYNCKDWAREAVAACGLSCKPKYTPRGIG